MARIFGGVVGKFTDGKAAGFNGLEDDGKRGRTQVVSQVGSDAESGLDAAAEFRESGRA